ncbi:MAG: alpha-L-fucosidase [Opitutus sp.]|nr:alpha-L-fucosidase [Opitutus sp.]
MKPTPLFHIGASLLAAAPATDSSAQREQRLAWFRHDKFGMFIHWGLYAIPAGHWNGTRAPGNGEWIMQRLRVPSRDYARLATQFNPVKFDADAWAQLAADAGMKYVVLTTKHHDGFSLFKSTATKFSTADATPLGRDVVRELAGACARRGLRFGAYYSQSLDSHERGGLGNDWDFPPDETKDRDGSFDRYLREKAEPQVRELLTNYGPLGMVWFDMATLVDKNDRAARLSSLVRTLQPAALVNGRTGASGDYRTAGDNAIPPTASADAWEVPVTINHTWGFRSDDHGWKSPGELVFTLVDTVSKGGNLLLNVGPAAEGVIPPPSQDALRTIGAWLRDWRCTTRPGRLYFTIFKTDRDGDDAYFVLPAFKNNILSVHEMDRGKLTPFALKTLPDGRRYFMPPRWVDDSLGTVYVIEIEGDTIVR